jgi:hypothetical protein
MDEFAEVCEQIASRGDPVRKARLMSDYLNSLASEERAIAKELFTVRRKPLVGGVAVRDALIAITGWDAGVVRACREATGDTAETNPYRSRAPRSFIASSQQP